MTFADVSDVRPRVGRPITQSEESLATAWLGDALRYIRRGFAKRGLDLDTQIALFDPSDVDVAAVQAEAVAVRLRHFDPEGLTSVTKTLDDGSITKRREGKPTDDYSWLTGSQWDQLLPLANVQSGAGSTRPGFQPDSCGPWRP